MRQKISLFHRMTPSHTIRHRIGRHEHERPEVFINRLLELEEEIKTDLQELLVLVTNTEPMEAQP